MFSVYSLIFVINLFSDKCAILLVAPITNEIFTITLMCISALSLMKMLI